MGTEIERKFRVEGAWPREGLSPTPLRQGYVDPARAEVRVRIKSGKAKLTIKSSAAALSRLEVEVPLDLADAEALLAAVCPHQVEKERFRVPHGAHTFEVDIFDGRHQGLTLAEVELAAEDDALDLPDWLGAEVTGDPAYYNANLARASRPPQA